MPVAAQRGDRNPRRRVGKAFLPSLAKVSVWLLIGSFSHMESRSSEAKESGKKVVKRPESSAFDRDLQVHFYGLQAVLFFTCILLVRKKMTKRITRGLNNLLSGNAGQSHMSEGPLSDFVPQMERWEMTPDSRM